MNIHFEYIGDSIKQNFGFEGKGSYGYYTGQPYQQCASLSAMNPNVYGYGKANDTKRRNETKTGNSGSIIKKKTILPRHARGHTLLHSIDIKNNAFVQVNSRNGSEIEASFSAEKHIYKSWGYTT